MNIFYLQKDISEEGSRSDDNLHERLRVVKVINLSYLVALFVLGIILISVSAWMISAKLWYCPILNIIYIGSWITLSLGILSAALSVVGSVIHFQSKPGGYFLPFMIGTGILTVGLIVVLILSAKIGTDIEEGGYATPLYGLFVEAKYEYSTRLHYRPFKCWDSFQKDLFCCGGFKWKDWLRSVTNTTANSSSVVWYPSVPRSCFCSSEAANITCIDGQYAGAPNRRLYKEGCISKILDTSKNHLTVLKIVTPCVAVFIVSHLTLSLCFTFRASRMSTVDVYTTDNEVAGSRPYDYDNDGSIRRGNRFADVSGVAPLALQLETTVGCT